MILAVITNNGNLALVIFLLYLVSFYFLHFVTSPYSETYKVLQKIELQSIMVNISNIILALVWNFFKDNQSSIQLRIIIVYFSVSNGIFFFYWFFNYFRKIKRRLLIILSAFQRIFSNFHSKQIKKDSHEILNTSNYPTGRLIDNKLEDSAELEKKYSEILLAQLQSSKAENIKLKLLTKLLLKKLKMYNKNKGDELISKHKNEGPSINPEGKVESKHEKEKDSSRLNSIFDNSEDEVQNVSREELNPQLISVELIGDKIDRNFLLFKYSCLLDNKSRLSLRDKNSNKGF